MTLLLLAALGLAASPPDLPNSVVTLPWSDFKTLYEQGRAPEDPPPTAPRDYTIDRAVYTGRVVGEGEDAYVLIHVSLSGHVLKAKGWSAIPLASTNGALRAARVNGREGAIYPQANFYHLLTDRPGPFTAELELAVGLFEANGETGFSLPVPAAGASTMSFSLSSKEELSLTLAGAKGQEVRRVGDVWTLTAPVPATGNVALGWSRKMQEEQAKESRVYAETHVLVGVAEGFLQGRATVNYTVLHRGIQRLRVQLPPDVTLLEVEGPGIEDWKQGADGVVDLALNFEALGSYRLILNYERPLTAGAGVLPVPRVLDVAREKSWIGVDARSAVELVAGAARNASPVDVRELPAAIVGQTDHPVLLGWKARGGEVSIPLEVKTHPDVDMLVTLVDATLADTLVTPDGRRMTRVRYAVRNNRNQFLRLKMPEGAEVWSASVAGRAVKVAKGDEGLLIPLVRSDASAGGALSAFAVELVYVENGAPLGDAGVARAELPRVDAPTSQLQWTVYFPENGRISKRSYQGTVRHVPWYSSQPQLPPDAVVTEAQKQAVQAAARASAAAGVLGQGVEPVRVELPLAGQTVLFEKMLVLDEPLWVAFAYRMKKAR